MATFLDLAKDVARESGTLSPSAITSVEGLTGRPEKVVGWVRRAWVNIQNLSEDWPWMIKRFSAILIPGALAYTPASFNITDWARWMPDHPELDGMVIHGPFQEAGEAGSELRQISHQAMERYVRGFNGEEGGKPQEWAIMPDNQILFWPRPDNDYVVRGYYHRSPQILTLATDVPEMPARFHDMIIWEAIRLMMLHDGAYGEAQAPASEFIRMRNELEIAVLPEVTLG